MTSGFVRLDLTKAPSVKFEVDNILKLFKKYRSSGEQAQLQALRRRISDRVVELEDFYAQNDDPRAALFEFQRLRLVKEMTQGGRSSAEKKAAAASNQQAEATKARRRKIEKGRTLPTMEAERRKEELLERARQPSPSKKKVAPLYSWEVAADQDEEDKLRATMRKPMVSSDGTFLPTNVIGFYARPLEDGGEDEDEALNASQYTDFQVVLTQKEFQVLQHRRRTLAAEQKHRNRLQRREARDHGFLFSQIPYMEHTRIQENLLRPPNKSRWVSDTDFML
eukprot:CAMPEP_0118885938 /NCGR_PEP_ID=MMETSP1163-20130328/24206_1 /TAXON_ID=124430 /ORGANISM="Phaeomonas parva, Strain CCMP2877" /LENGTH=279 /DNA_ID=CAMNT_0006824031 /DNA_START=106 /DNA_END=945 /DNA_ORIENTATION=+